MLGGEQKAGMVTPLVDVVFNLMITMFVFLMIYMAVVIPRKDDEAEELHFLRKRLSETAAYVDYFANIPVTGGSGSYTFLFQPRGTMRSLRIGPESSRIISQGLTGGELTPPGTGAPTVPPGGVLEGKNVGKIVMETASGLLQARFLAGAARPLLEQPSAVPPGRAPSEEPERTLRVTHEEEGSLVAFDVVVIDNLKRVREPTDRAEQWGELSLFFHEEHPKRDASKPSSSDSPRPEREGPDELRCHLAIRGTIEIPVKPKAVPFDPEKSPLGMIVPSVVQGKTGIPLEETLSPFGGIEPYDFRLSPPLDWLELDKAKGRMSGVPTEAGQYELKVELKDDQTPPGDWRMAEEHRDDVGRPYVTESLRLMIEETRSLDLRVLLPRYARVGEPVHAAAVAKGGVGRRRFGAYGLPPGLEIDPDSGQIRGIPTQAGRYQVQVQVTDENPDLDRRSRTVDWGRPWYVIPPRPDARIIDQGGDQ